ncbi:MAG TPA: HEAT repeat domain-containing protein [Tepidisphaeraceae bacterium]|nr:HEAT repeat domain-containing protein [Tepidisphaeraceae bacterium]
MIDQLINALVESRNEAADDTLLEALRVGNEVEQSMAMGALLRRKTVHGLSGIITAYESLSQQLQLQVLASAGHLHHALRECGRSELSERRVAALRLIAVSRQGRLSHVVAENLHESDEQVSKTACEALTALARWIATETKRLQKGEAAESAEIGSYLDALPGMASENEARPLTIYQQIVGNRPDIENAVARAIDVHRGKHGHDLLRAALLLADWPDSKTLAVLQAGRHGGQSPMIRRLQQPPAAEHVEGFLLAASHAQVRSHFGQVFAHIVEAPVLDALLRKTHWLKDHQLQICMHLVSRGVWWDEKELLRDLDRRQPNEAAKVGEWIAVSQVHDVLQDDRLEKLRQHCTGDVGARLRLLRIALRRRRGASVQFIKSFLTDPDERLARLAAREIVRRKPLDYENILLPLMTTAAMSVRKVISRAIGHAGFEQFWQRFDRMDKATRRQAGKAMLKLLPDGLQRMSRRLEQGPADGRVKAMVMVQELQLIDRLKGSIFPLVQHANARVRSKAISLVGELPSVKPEVILEKALNDQDPRVRANAIEVLEETRNPEFVPLLTERARSSHNRERANAIKALHKMKVGTAKGALISMLKDQRGEHRISALWAMRQIGFWELVQEVGRMAREDQNMRVRRYAVGVIRTLAEIVQQHKDAQLKLRKAS